MRSRLLAASARLAVITAVALLAPAAAFPAPSGLAVIPTADILEANIASIETESNGPTLPFARDCESFALFQIGLSPKVEAGIDFCTSSTEGPWLNIKSLLREENERIPAIAVDLQGIGRDTTAEPYLVLSKSLSPTRAHLGLIRTGHRGRVMLGLDTPISRELGVSADYIAGGDNTTSVALSGDVAEGVGVTFGRIFANGAGGEDTWYFNLAYELPLTQP